MTKSTNTSCCAQSAEIAVDKTVQDACASVAKPGVLRDVFHIDNMDCPTEQALIEKTLLPMTGISHLQFNLLDRKLTVDYINLERQTIQLALSKIGMQARYIDNKTASSSKSSQAEQPSIALRDKIITGIALLAAVFAESLSWIYGEESAWYVILLASVAIFLSGFNTYYKGWIALKNFNLNINALMSIAVTGAVLIGQWPEAAMVMVLFSIAEMIELLSLARARNAIKGLMALTPETTTIKQANGQWLDVATSTVSVDMIVRIKPGERIPLDGELLEGQSAVDQSPITGESIPVAKAVGDKVFAGSINQTGLFEYKVSALSNQSVLARIIQSVEQAQSKKAATQRFVDRFAKIYTPTVFIFAILVALLAPLFWHGVWFDWIYKALVLLVIACPCALVISTPVTVVSGLAAAAKKGILIKGGVYLESGHLIEMLALDKTGTITQGKPQVTDVIELQSDVRLAQDINPNFLIAASLASHSDHPVSLAITQYLKNAQVSDNLFEAVTEFTALTGRGIQAKLNEKTYSLGNHRLLEELGLCNIVLEQKLLALEAQGKTVVILADSQQPLLLIAVADSVKESSRQAISQLNDMAIKTVMLTGDNVKTAKAIAENVGLTEFEGELLPEDKLNFIVQALHQHKSVAMVGDGINDAPALAAASIGFAMGAMGTDTAIETADVALMDDDLRKIPEFIQLSRKTSRILKQNITLALSIKIIFMLFAFYGMATLWMAVFADMGASLLVIANGLRLVKS